MDTINPMVLDGSGNLRLFLGLDQVPYVSHFRHEDMPPIHGNLAGVGVQIAVQKLVGVNLGKDAIQDFIDLVGELSNIVIIESVLEYYLLL